MDIHRYSTSEGFFDCSEPLADPAIAAFDSFRGRLLSLIEFFEKAAIVPLAFLFKSYKTTARFLGVVLSAALLVLTVCSSLQIRELFVRRVSSLAQDLADWVLWPVAVASCLGRLLLAALVHPALYFGF